MSSSGARRRPSRWAAGAATLVPVAWVPVALAHPITFGGALDDGQINAWLGAHLAQLALVPLLALAMLYVLAGLAGWAAAVARVAVILWAVLFSAYESVTGVATGVLARAGAEDAARTLFEHRGVGGEFSVLGVVAHPMWGVVAVATAVALQRASARRTTRVTMLLTAPFALMHAGIIAALVMISLAVAIWTALIPLPSFLEDQAAARQRRQVPSDR